MHGTFWIKYSVLAVVVSVALAAPVGAATPDAWITTKTKLSLLTTEGVSGTAIHVDTILGKVRTAEEKAKAESTVNVDVRLLSAIRGISKEARQALLRYDYPGNVRELENLIERAVVLSRYDVIGRGDLPLTLDESEEKNEPETQLTAAVEGLERRMIKDALTRAGGVQTRAADILGITERALRYKLKKYGLQGEEPDSL